ncbi:ArsR/SmtB family transcription factor [Streptomyces sp. NPDC048481]|uniref:ArsR/SmtB family transcription factor n=1 Tax=Streptomyces sp. NPDC048481 TaxID=3365557 RepID=UPI00371E68E7
MPPTPKEPGASEPAAPIELGDLATLKALAQPRRRRMLEHLTLHGPATSATLARALGLNTGSTSYHLRELARYGFVEETAEATTEEAAGETSARTPARTAAEADGALRPGGCPEPSAQRRRWWRAVPGDRRFPPRSRQSPAMREVMDELNHHVYASDVELFERLQRDAPDGDPWCDAFPYSRGALRLTPPELREFFEEYIALLNRYKRPGSATPPGARIVLTRFFAHPAPDHPDGPVHLTAPDDTTETDPS